MADSSEDDRKLTVEEKNAHEAYLAARSDGSTKKKVKPALKKKTRSGKPKMALKWDEDAIEEHNLLRGTRMKIEEPNTPYTFYDSGQESDDSRHTQKSPKNQKSTLSWDTLQNKLDSVAAVRDAYPSSPSSHGGEQSAGEQSDVQSDAEEEARKKKEREMKKLEFKELRYVIA